MKARRSIVTDYKILHAHNPDTLSIEVTSHLQTGFSPWGPPQIHGNFILQAVIKRESAPYEPPEEPTDPAEPSTSNPPPNPTREGDPRCPDSTVQLSDIVPIHWDGQPIRRETLAQLIRANLSKHQILARSIVKHWIQNGTIKLLPHDYVIPHTPN